MILYMYKATGQGQTAPWGQSFDVNRNVSSLHPIFLPFAILLDVVSLSANLFYFIKYLLRLFTRVFPPT